MIDSMPAYLYPLDLTGAVATVIALLFILNGTLKLARFSDRDRIRGVWTGTALLTAWFLAALLPSWFGFYGRSGNRIPTIQYGLLIPIFAGVAMFRLWPALRRVVEAVPQQWIVSLQVYRALGVIFLVLYAGGRLPGAFALPAGIGDITVGLLAPFVGAAYARGSRGSAARVRAWNLLGIADLVVAVTTGMLTSPSPLQLLAFDNPNTLISAFPLVMIPVFLVPLSILLHLASLSKLPQTEAERDELLSARRPPNSFILRH
jgi:hypothetical protein